MNSTTHDFVTVDMRGLKAALVARSRAERVSVSVIVRRAVAREIGFADGADPDETAAATCSATAPACLKLSIRMTAAEVQRLVAGCRAARMSRGAYLAGLIAGIPLLTHDGSRPDHLAALVTSGAELATLSRNLNHLTTLLRQGEVQAALVYADMLKTLERDVRGHLAHAAGVLAELQPRRSTGSRT